MAQSSLSKRLAPTLLAQGYHLLGHWPARALAKPTTSPAGTLAQLESTTNKVNDEYIPFVNAATSYAYLSFVAPKSIDEGTGIVAVYEWTEAGSASSHDCVWQAEYQGQGDGDSIDTAFGTAVTVTDTGSSGTRRFATLAATIPANISASDKVIMRIARLGSDGSDSLNVDARLISVTLYATFNAQDDT